MDENKEAERKALIAEHARKQLRDGTWPQVMAIIGYSNPQAQPTTDEEFDRLKAAFTDAQCMNIAKFVDIVRFVEREHLVPVSFNLSLRRRYAPDETQSDVTSFFLTPDILVGTRRGVEGAAIWLKNFTEAMPHLASESLQIMDKIFGEAVTIYATGMPQTVSIEDMFKAATTGKGRALKRPPDPAKN